jgi:hypothetical protein
MLSGGALYQAVTFELYRIGARPFWPGGQDIGTLSFPGGQPPTLEYTYQPAKIPALADTFAGASTFASGLLRGERIILNMPAGVAAVVASAVGGPPVPTGESATNGAGAGNGASPEPSPVERTPKEIEMSKLLTRQNALVDLPEMDAAAEAEYQAIGRQIAALT